MVYRVQITRAAERDLAEIVGYIATHDAPAKAEALLDRLTELIDRLALFPDRGAFPPELLALGIKEFRQVNFKPYRVIYRVIRTKVFVMLIADSRRELQALLSRRLLGR